MAGFCEFLSTLWSGNWNPAWKSTFTSDTTQILSFHVSGVKWCPFWWLKEKVKGSFGSRFLVFGVWIPSFWLYGGVLRICRAEETFFSSYEQHLAHARVQRKWLFLATLHLKYRMGGVQKFSFRVHHYCSRCCVFELHKWYCWDQYTAAVHLWDFPIMDLFSVLSQWVHLHVLYNKKATAIRNAFTWDFEIIVTYHLSPVLMSKF